jgi:hypothetical protein
MSERGIVRNRAIVCVFDLNREDWRQVDHEYMLEKKWELVRIGFMCNETLIFFYMVVSVCLIFFFLFLWVLISCIHQPYKYNVNIVKGLNSVKNKK